MEIDAALRWFSHDFAIVPFRLGHWAGNEVGHHGRQGDDPETLMPLEHLCAFFKPGLQLGVALGLLIAETEIRERGLLR
jgi:hypothetical protein